MVDATPECAGADADNVFDCLRSANTSTLLQAYNVVQSMSPEAPYPFTPCIDGPDGLIPDHPYKLLSEGHFSRIPFISGTNEDEGESS